MKTRNWILVVSLFVVGIVFIVLQGYQQSIVDILRSEKDGVEGITASFHSDIWKIVFGITSSICLTIAVSIFVVSYVTKETRKAVNEDVFNALFKSMLPIELFQVIQKALLHNNKIRKDSEWILDVVQCEDNPSNLNLTRTVRYNLENIGHATMENSLRIALKEGKDSSSKLISFECRSEGETILKYPEVEGESPPLKDQYNFTLEEKVGSKPFEIKASIPIKSKKSMEFTFIWEHTIPKGRMMVHYCKYPMINARILINYPSNLNFNIVSTFSSGLKLDIDTETRKQYKADGGILPGQGFVYFLEERVNENEGVAS